MTDKEAIQYVISKVNNADEKGVELTEFDINKVETLISIINRQQAEIEDLNHSIDTLGRVKEQLKENLSATEEKYQKEITRLDALLVCKNKAIRNLEKSFENAYDGLKGVTTMAEYIEREEVLKHKRKMSGADFGGEFWDEAVLCEDIRKIPTADVVPVVRCKDCKWLYKPGLLCTHKRNRVFNTGIKRDFNCYCNYGEKEDEGK